MGQRKKNPKFNLHSGDSWRPRVSSVIPVRTTENSASFHFDLRETKGNQNNLMETSDE